MVKKYLRLQDYPVYHQIHESCPIVIKYNRNITHKGISKHILAEPIFFSVSDINYFEVTCFVSEPMLSI